MVVGGEHVPLLPVYVGLHPRPGSAQAELGVQPLHRWKLWVHPDWPDDVVLVGSMWPPSLEIDVLPPQSTVALEMVVDEAVGAVVVPRHPG